MYNTKFITVNGKDLYPGYFGRELRILIRDQYREKRNICGVPANSRLSSSLPCPRKKRNIYGVPAIRMQDFIIKSVRI